MAENNFYKEKYFDDVVRLYVIAAMFWGVVAFSAGTMIALQLVFPALNFSEYATFGRLRPLHTSAAIIAFGGNILIGCSFYIVQRTCKIQLYGGKLGASMLFCAFQLFIVIATIGYILGITQSKEYAEPEWYADILFAFTWFGYLIIYGGTLLRRKEKHIYVSNWFFLAFIITVAILHVVNNIAIPISLTKSYTVYAGVQDAMVQWWYGHNMVGFWLTAGFIGMMYYFIPKQAEKPVYSYRLSIVHFWALVFIYIWAGPHHLHYTALPEWTQTLGMVFSIMLWMPSWGGMINGIMTLSGAWKKLVTDPVIRFLVVAVAFYGMSTFEGPLMALKQVNALSHYTDWTIGHVHSGALGWVGMISFGALYYVIPRLWGRKNMASKKLIEIHFILATLGIVIYTIAMWISGISQGLLWRTYNEYGFLKYSFVDVVQIIKPYHLARAIGGICFLAGFLTLVINAILTIKQGKKEMADAKLLNV